MAPIRVGVSRGHARICPRRRDRAGGRYVGIPRTNPQEPAIVGVAAETPRPPPHGMLAIEMLAHEHAQARAAAAPPLLVDLQEHTVEADGVVARHHALLFVTQDLIEVVATDRDEGTRGIGGGVSEAGVVIGDEAVAQIAVGHGHRADLGHRSSLTRRPCRVPLARSLRPRACGEKPTMCSMPSVARARPTWVSLLRSGAVPEVGVYTAHPARSV